MFLYFPVKQHQTYKCISINSLLPSRLDTLTQRLILSSQTFTKSINQPIVSLSLIRDLIIFYILSLLMLTDIPMVALHSCLDIKMTSTPLPPPEIPPSSYLLSLPFQHQHHQSSEHYAAAVSAASSTLLH